jgi:hypothetical protein
MSPPWVELPPLDQAAAPVALVTSSGMGGLVMCARMTTSCAVAVFIGVVLLTGCSSGPTNTTGAGGVGGSSKAFLDQKKEVPARKEWTREVTSRSGGPFTFRVASQGPFAVTVITDKGYKALQSGKGKPAKDDVLLTVDCKEPTLEKSVTVPPGSSWFIIENQTDKSVEIHLQCFAP